MDRRQVIAGGLGAAGVIGVGAGRSASASYGRFVGSVRAEWGKDGRHMKLLDEFTYIDPSAREWKVPKGAVVDGASIPKVFWSVIGGPFEGLYRNASVVHDWYCDVRTRPWKQVDEMFYNGMLASGVDQKMARLLYLAVYAGGPRWDDQAIENNRLAISRKLNEFSRDPTGGPSQFLACDKDSDLCKTVYKSQVYAQEPTSKVSKSNPMIANWEWGKMTYSAAANEKASPVIAVALQPESVTPPIANPEYLKKRVQAVSSSPLSLSAAEHLLDQERAARGRATATER